jgi:hypothetical protein
MFIIIWDNGSQNFKVKFFLLVAISPHILELIFYHLQKVKFAFLEYIIHKKLNYNLVCICILPVPVLLIYIQMCMLIKYNLGWIMVGMLTYSINVDQVLSALTLLFILKLILQNFQNWLLVILRRHISSLLWLNMNHHN